MSTNIKIHNTSNLSQQLNLAPQLLNWLKILQVSSLDLTDLVNNELSTNPALETASPEDPVGSDDYSTEDFSTPAELALDGSEVGERLGVLADIDEEWRTADVQPLATNQSLREKHDFMMDQLVKASALQDEIEEAILFSDLDGKDEAIARIIAGSIDVRGYLDTTLEEIALLAGASLSAVETALKKFQSLAPAGIGARDFRECLVLQLRVMDADTELAQLLVTDWLDTLAQQRYAALAEHLAVDVEDVVAAFDLIRTLDPEPGKNYNSAPVEYVEADLEICVKNGELEVELLDHRLPRLQLSSYCKRLLEAKNGSKKDLEYIRNKVREATFLIQGISQRQDTMLKVTRQIMRVQREFLSSEDGQLQPLTMNKVAAMIGVHETTVSRAIANKYIRTERGLLDMRSFFKVGYRCADGSSVTPERVKKQLGVFVGAEEEMKPRTDAQLSELFKKQGLKVARRTIAKYREEMGIPSSKERLASVKRRARSHVAMAV